MINNSDGKLRDFLKKEVDEDGFKIRNMLSSIERTFLPLGSKIGKYQVIEEIDRGGMAVVYKACQLDLDRIVALKVLPANVTINRNFVERFLSEAHAVAKLQHPNIVNIHEIAVENNLYYLVMDYIAGKNLFYYLNQEKPKLVEVLDIVKKLTDALGYAHEQKILHRDLKLNNVIMKDNKHPVLIDFGLAKAMGSDNETNLTKSGEIIGSPAYMAPERVFGEGVDARSDICSLGIMLYEMLTFKNPYLDPRSMVQTTKNVVEANPVRPRNLVAWLPIEVESITLKAMAADPDDRYASMKEFGEDIVRYQRGEPVIASPPSMRSKIRRFFQRHWAPVVIGMIVTLFSMALIVVIAIQSAKERWRWQLVFHETFNTSNVLDYWSVFDERCGENTARDTWIVRDSALCAVSTGYSYIRFERPFTRDLKIEFDIKTAQRDLFHTGFFICGNVPDSGYCFRIHDNAAMINGVRFPGSSFLFYEYDPSAFTVDSQYHVTVEKKDHVITFWLNATKVARIFDCFPLLGKEYQKIGFFINGSSVVFDNLKVYRRSVPLLAQPTIIADRFWEQGDFETALDEYKEVLFDLSRNEIVWQIRFKMVDCLIRLRRFDEAEKVISDIEKGKKITDYEKSRLLFFRSLLSIEQNRTFLLNHPSKSLARFYPASMENLSLASQAVRYCYELFHNGRIDSAEAQSIIFLNTYPGFIDHFARIHLEILAYYTQSGDWKNAQEVGKRIIALYPKNEEIVFEARILLAKICMGMGEKQKAIDLLNQCLTSLTPSVAKWHAWLLLADIAVCSHNYTDAYTIYRKIYEECPRTIVYAWLAPIHMSEMVAYMETSEHPDQILKKVINANHPFALPRLVAQFYAGKIKRDSFKRQWQLLNHNDSFFHYYYAKRYQMENNYHAARKHLRILLPLVPRISWEYVLVYSALQEVDNF